MKSFIISKAAIVVAPLAMLVATQAASANLITNGDFSANASSFTEGPGYYGYVGFTNPSNATGWTATGNSGVNGGDTGANVQNVFGPTSLNISTGGTVTDFAFLQNWTPQSTLSQAFAATSGQAYVVNFVAASRAGQAADMTVAVLNGSSVLGGIGTSTPVIPGNTDFTPYSFSFTATGGNLTLEFFNNSPQASNTVPDASFAVSDVSISAVPEPATLGLMGVGALGLLLIGRKRKMA